MSLGERIKEQRNKLNMTQSELAEKLELSLVMVKKMEGNTKQPSLDTLEKLSYILKVPTDYLLGNTTVITETRAALIEYRDSKATDTEKKIIDELLELSEIDNFFDETYEILMNKYYDVDRINKEIQRRSKISGKKITKLTAETFKELSRKLPVEQKLKDISMFDFVIKDYKGERTIFGEVKRSDWKDLDDYIDKDTLSRFYRLQEDDKEMVVRQFKQSIDHLYHKSK